MSAKHTQGPWHDYTDPMSGMLYITDDAGNTIAMTSPMEDDPQAESANARLIAAASDMLAALEQALTHIEVDETTHGRNFAAGNVVRTAIARATGETP